MKRVKTIFSSTVLVFAMTGTALAGPAEQYDQGVREFQNGRYEKAVTLLRSSLDGKPTAKAALYLGNTYLKLGELDLAKGAFETVLRLEPNHPKKPAIETLIRSIDARAEVAVRVESTPAGASVFVDDGAQSIGTTPADVKITVGRHRVHLVKEGYAKDTREITLEPGAPAEVKVALVGKGCETQLSVSNLASAQASVDGGPPVAVPGKTVIPAGEHKVRFTAPNYEAKEEIAKCDGFAPGSLTTTLAIERGRLTLPVTPGTIVKVDGQIVNVTPEDAEKGLGLLPGRHEVSITTPDEPTKTTIIDVKPGEAITLGTDKAPTGAFPTRALYFEAQGGGNITLRDWKLGANSFRSQSGATRGAPGSSGMAGLRVGFQVSPRFAVETEVNWIALPTELDTSTGLAYNLNVLYHLTDSRWAPFVEGGVGAYQVVAGQLGSDLSGRGHLGVGFRGRIAKRISVRAEVRDVVSKGFEAGGSNNLEMLAGAELFVF